MATLRRSNGTILASNLSAYNLFKMIHSGHALPTTPGDASNQDVTLVSTAKDTLFLAASPANPVVMGPDNVLFLARRYPE